MKFNVRKVGSANDIEYRPAATSPSRAVDKTRSFQDLLDFPGKVAGIANYPRELNSVRLLLVLHLVLHFCLESFGPAYFENSFVRRFAEWGAVQFSSLFCLEGLILAIKYGRSISKAEPGEHDQLDTGLFWKRHALEIYPIYLVACVASWAFQYLVGGVNDWRQLVLTVTTLDAWMPSGPEMVSKDPMWVVAAYMFFLGLFPVVMRMASPANKGTLLNIMVVGWLATAVVPLAFVGFDMEIGSVPHLFTLGRTFPLVHATSFIFGILLGLYYLKGDSEGLQTSASAFVATATLSAMVVVYCTQEMFTGHYLLWAYDGMFLPFTAFLLFVVASGKDVVLCPLLRAKPVAESFGSIALTVYLLQGFFVGVAKYMLEVENHTVFWTSFWVMLLVSSFFLHKVYSVLYVQHILPWLVQTDEVLIRNVRHDEHERSEYPCRGWWWADNFLAKLFRLTCYYGAMAATIGFYMVLALRFDWKGFYSVYDMPWANAFINLCKYGALLSLPSLTFSMIGHILFPPVLRVRNAPLDLLKKDFKHKVFFRIVTRGKHPNLVRGHVAHASAVLRSVLPFNQFCLEVATDNPLDLANTCPGMAVELLVPKEFAPRGGAKFKARALQYSIEASAAEPGDWIVHLDEETRFDAETVRGVLAHCIQQDAEIAAGKKTFGNIGQGVILYGTQEPDNWLTTLADSVRVGDDFGKFRIQYELHEPLIGMHGSFVVCQNAVERLVTFDHGMEGSITEDAYFALVAQVKGVKFSWIDSFMYEQSPFSCNDFMHQRCRWFAGLWLIVLSKRIPFLNRAVLLFFMATWAATPLIWLAMTLCMCVASDVPYWFRGCIGLISGMSTWGYLLGFFFTFRPSDGGMRYLVLFGLQMLLQPLFAAMELSGVILGIFKPPTEGFHIVQKEGSNVMKSLQSSNELSATRNTSRVSLVGSEVV